MTRTLMPTAKPDHYEHLARQALASGTHFQGMIDRMAARTRLVADESASPAGPNGDGREGVMPEFLARQAAHLIDEDANLAQLAERSGDPLALRHGLARLPLPPQLAFMLEVAKEQRPELFQHLLAVTLMAHYLALRLGLSERETASLLIAALCHDLGELHTDPALLNPQHRISDDERRYIYVHPITGHLIAREIAGIDPAIPAAVLQHQERIDGSGYPYGLRAGKIGMFARIIGSADVCAAILTRFGSNQRLSALMRLNREKFDPKLLALLQDGFDHRETASAATDTPTQPRLAAAASLLERWVEFRIALTGDGHDTPRAGLEFLFERMVSLRSMLLQFGFDPDSQQLLMTLAGEDPQLAAELAAALDEVHWQFMDLEREIARRRAGIAPALTDAENRYLDGWIVELQAYLRTTDA
ncbi:MAG: HD domain-containing phosphohydrolase [Rhodocyclaceae bacterium]|nr:HD domain-containing phosphohydrolase [Rhodocyclaceae bacterium]